MLVGFAETQCHSKELWTIRTVGGGNIAFRTPTIRGSGAHVRAYSSSCRRRSCRCRTALRLVAPHLHRRAGCRFVNAGGKFEAVPRRAIDHPVQIVVVVVTPQFVPPFRCDHRSHRNGGTNGVHLVDASSPVGISPELTGVKRLVATVSGLVEKLPIPDFHVDHRFNFVVAISQHRRAVFLLSAP